jgi:ribosomal 50S subunit-recycling heat shock protein
VDLETRLDAVVLRAGFSRTIYQARQAVSHGHVTVNGQRVDRPSFHVRPGDVIEVAASSRSKTPFVIAATGEYAASAPPYLEVDADALRARLVRLPARSEIPVVCDERLVVEFYSGRPPRSSGSGRVGLPLRPVVSHCDRVVARSGKIRVWDCATRRVVSAWESTRGGAA